MTALIPRAVAEQVQREIRDALGMPDLPVYDVMVRSGAWQIAADRPAAAHKGAA